MNKRNGFTLVELLIVMTTIIILAIMMVGVLDPASLINKSRDSQRKKDLFRIKQAFEEYFNNKGYYPQDVSSWNIKSNCHTNIFSPYLNPWPCDPNGNPYLIIVETNKFRVMTNLENKEDNDIPKGWYVRTDIILTGATKDEVNYGVSSSNILWYEKYIDPNCDITECAQQNVDGSGGCNSVSYFNGCSYEEDGDNCYFRYITGECMPQCKTYCCGNGCD